MKHLSLKGVARKYLDKTGVLSVVRDVFDVPAIAGSVSLRERLELLARETHSFDKSECTLTTHVDLPDGHTMTVHWSRFEWTARFEQTWTHIRVRIRLRPVAGITAATMANLRNTWKTGIESTWSNQWACGRDGELACPLTFEVLWVSSRQHHRVRVRVGPARSNMTTWDTVDTGGSAAHEFGHMLGNDDEYNSRECPDRNPVNTGTVMDNNAPNVPRRMMRRFADNIGSEVVGM